MFITRSSTFMQDLKLFFKMENISKVQSAVGSLLMLEVYKEVVAAVVEKVKQKDESSPVMFNVREMAAEGLAKLRYVGVWAVRKVLNKLMQFVKLHMSSTVPSTQLAVTKSHRMCSLLEDRIDHCKFLSA